MGGSIISALFVTASVPYPFFLMKNMYFLFCNQGYYSCLEIFETTAAAGYAVRIVEVSEVVDRQSGSTFSNALNFINLPSTGQLYSLPSVYPQFLP